MNHPYVNKYKQDYTNRMAPRGYSTAMDSSTTTKLIELVHKHIHHVQARRKEIIEELGETEESCWGQGIIIFCPKLKKVVATGSHTRFLPYLLPSVRVTKNAWMRTQIFFLINTASIQENIYSSVQEWLQHSRSSMNKYDRIVVKFLCALRNGPRFDGKKGLYGAIIETNNRYNEVQVTIKEHVMVHHSVQSALICDLLQEKRSNKHHSRLYARNDSMFV